jgi:hypothetical protein
MAERERRSAVEKNRDERADHSDGHTETHCREIADSD